MNEVWCVEKKFGEQWKPIASRFNTEDAQELMAHWDSYPSSYTYRIKRYIPAPEAA
jgi:hypothetical protein